MIRLLRLALVVIVLVVLAALLLGRRSRLGEILPESPPDITRPIDTAKARELGAKVGEATANAVQQAEDALATGGVTAKIKSKMALDELVKARNIDVDINGTIVTLSGVVGSEAERQRAIQLAKETGGVTKVIDHLRTR